MSKVDYKKLVQSLSDESITKKQYDKNLKLIEDRVNQIWRDICLSSRRKLDWWAFSNDVDYGNGNGSSGGFFNPDTDSEFIEIIGYRTSTFNSFYELENGFPTEFLWDDNFSEKAKKIFDDAKNKLAEEKEKKKTSHIKNNAKKLELKKSIQSKVKKILTDEEFKHLSFLMDRK